MTLDESLLLANGLAYFSLFLGFQWTIAKFHGRLLGAWLAGLTSLVFSILFLYRATGIEYGESDVVTWLFRLGVFVFCVGTLTTLRTLTQPADVNEPV